MSLPLQAIDRLFERLTATYGRHFLSLYEGLDVGAVKASWGHELSGFSSNLQAIAWALENLPEQAPNAIAFRNLCRRAPEAVLPRLPEPPADPARIRAELEKLGPARAAMKEWRGANTDWAHAIVAKHDAGLRVAPLVLSMARFVVNRRGGLPHAEVIDA